MAFSPCVAPVLSGCSASPVQCTSRDAGGTGRLSSDILGTWAGSGIDSAVFQTFQLDAGVKNVESPNRYASQGNVWWIPYAVDGGQALVDGRWWDAEVDGGFLVLSISDAGVSFAYPALTCTGFGFE